MKINALEIDGYGIWSGLRIERLADGLNVLYGPNEAGKTTLLQFIRSMLYGFSHARRQYFPPINGGKPGGIIDVTGPAGRFEIARHLQNAGGEEVVLTAPDGTCQGEHLVKLLLSNIDEAIFNNVFAVELRELQELATLGDTEAAELLYNLTAGLDRISLVEVLRELEVSRNRILDAGGNPSQVTQLWAEREKLRAEIDELGSLTRRWSHLVAERNQINRDLTQLEEEKNQAHRQLRVAELAIALRNQWSRRKAIEDQLAAIGPLPVVPEGAIERLDDLNARLKKHQERIGQLQTHQEEFAAEATALKIDESLRRQSARIEALQEQEPWLTSLKTQIDELDSDIADLQSEQTSQWHRLGLGDNSIDDILPLLSNQSFAVLRSPAGKLRQCSAKLHQAKHEQEEANREADSFTHQIETGLAERQEVDLPSAMDRSGNLVAQYRRRIQIDERLDQLSRHQTELEERSRSLVEHQLLGVGVLAGLGAAFVLGVVLILAGLFMPASIVGSAGWALAILGVAGSGAAVSGKFLLEKSRASQLDSCQKNLVMLQAQVEQTKSEREQLDDQLPRGGGPIVSRLDAAEKDLATLEVLVPLETRRNSARQQATAAANRVSQAEAEYKSARRCWREALKTLGLPAKLSTGHARQLSERWQHLTESQRRVTEKRGELERRRQEWGMLTSRIAQVASDAGVTLDGTEVMEHLKQLSAALARQEADVTKQETIRRQIRRLRSRTAKHEEAISRLKHRRRELFFEAGAEDEAEFRRRAVEHARAEVLLKDKNTLNLDIAAAIGNQCSEEAIRKQLQEKPARELDSQTGILQARLDAVEAQIRQLIEKQGESSTNIQILADDRQLPNKQLKLAMVEKRLKEAVDRWQVLATTCSIMDRIRVTYEKERQPETLLEASEYLHRLTQGRYQRVWTPLGEKVLRVDDAEGHCLPVDKLSRGTREQLFLSLRMALAASYARRGAALPLVLDDVLVNFDAERAAAAAAVLHDFAATGHQLIVFTCHEHISNIFASLGVPVSRLPSSENAGRTSISFEIPEIRSEAENKRPRNRPPSKRKNLSKDKSLADEVEISSEPVDRTRPTGKPVKSRPPISDDKSKTKRSGVFDADFFDSDDTAEQETSEPVQNDSSVEEESDEDDEYYESDDGNSSEAA